MQFAEVPLNKNEFTLQRKYTRKCALLLNLWPSLPLSKSVEIHYLSVKLNMLIPSYKTFLVAQHTTNRSHISEFFLLSLVLWDELIALMMEAVHTSETLVNFNVTTWRYIPEDSKLHTHCCENLKSHILCSFVRL
jgi:hypothetical protein